MVERVFREGSGQAVATLARVFGDLAVAEDAVQDAFVVAAVRWRADGIPPNPAGWIITTARRRAIDQLRRSARGRTLSLNQQALFDVSGEADAHTDATASESAVSDDRLRLIFTCCHPSLRREHQVALTLRLLGGLSVEEIARGFLVTESAMTKRLSRAKYKIKAANIPYQVPAGSDLAVRLAAVLAVLYLIYNAGADDLERRGDLRNEAIRLARALVELMPDEPEPAGLLALMLLNESRTPARSLDGAAVLLRHQDRSIWDRQMIEEGHAVVNDCIRRGQPGPYQLQAAIQAVHCHASTFEATDWRQILELYDHLNDLLSSPVVALNRAIALAEVEGPERALRTVASLEVELADYAPFHAARASFSRDLGRLDDAAEAYGRAAMCASSAARREDFERERLSVIAQIEG